jgi:hypothetical protein
MEYIHPFAESQTVNGPVSGAALANRALRQTLMFLRRCCIY